MEASFDIVDWNELTKFPDSLAFGEWRLELEDEPEWILSDEDVGWLNDSGGTYCDIADALQNIGDRLPEPQADAVKKSLAVVLCVDDTKTRKDFPCVVESCYFLSLSPETVSQVASALKTVAVKPLAKALAAIIVENDPDQDLAEVEAEVRDYIAQTADLIKAAAAKKWGIIGHLG